MMTGRVLPFSKPLPLHRLALRASDLPLLALYGLAFALLHWASHPWSGLGFFSLWYPAAGLRFAVLWRRGTRLTPWLILTEVLTDGIVGTIPLTGVAAVQGITGAMRPGLTCGIAIAVARRLSRGKSEALALPPMILGIAAVLAPLLNAAMVLPFAMFLPDAGRYQLGVATIISLIGLTVGDLLGILVLAPALLWLAALIEADVRLPAITPERRRRLAAALLEHTIVLTLSLVLTMLMLRAGVGVRPAPGLLAGAWIGLRHGRVAAWVAILVQVAAFLPFSAVELDDGERLTLHLWITGIVLVTWLAGSFSDAQKAAREVLERRNRLLFQAERLKTLRAMSVAVIHEISQPLSTLAIEARHLRDATAGLDPDIADSAALVDRKAQALSELVRRLRRFGGRDVDEPAALPVMTLLQTARQIVAPELNATLGTLFIAPVPPDLVVQVQEIELTQALVNLLRNAIAASPGRTVSIITRKDGEDVRIAVSNPLDRPEPSGPDTYAGMGVGLVIARTIVEAHGGTLARGDADGSARFVLSLPLVPASPLPADLLPPDLLSGARA
ncbi:ATP-binding protein [Novosphingobium guangzhouense]|uniref:histidine kinase n=1 Tax=Novosphingobium guangzhouense TaxID=1850347 RepID=A0A2K2G116_9SPHN|nr:ATP-binding protein [Novosphingobium guangzhouense]PNU04736.1 histidine kinase [Novosphingobium guangzhouense]